MTNSSPFNENPQWGLPPTVSVQGVPQLPTRPIESQASAPPIGIAFLLFLTTGFAVHFASDQFLESSTSDEHWMLIGALRLLSGIGFACTFASPWLLFRIKQQSGKLFLHPGHKIFLFLLFFFFLDFGSRIFQSFLFSNTWELEGNDIFKYYFGLNVVFSIIKAFVAAIFIAFVLHAWRWVFVGLVMASMLNMLASSISFAQMNAWIGYFGITDVLTEWSFLVSIFVVAVPFFVAILLDLVASKKRDWFHWAGIGSFALAILLVPFIAQIYFRFLVPRFFN